MPFQVKKRLQSFSCSPWGTRNLKINSTASHARLVPGLKPLTGTQTKLSAVHKSKFCVPVFYEKYICSCKQSEGAKSKMPHLLTIVLYHIKTARPIFKCICHIKSEQFPSCTRISQANSAYYGHVAKCPTAEHLW